MKKKTIETLVAFQVKNKEYEPVKAAISEELQSIIGRVYQLDPDAGESLRFITGIMMAHFREDVQRVTYGDLSPLENIFNGLVSRIEYARLALFNNGIKDELESGNPMRYLHLALQDIEQIKKQVKKARLPHE